MKQLGILPWMGPQYVKTLLKNTRPGVIRYWNAARSGTDSKKSRARYHQASQVKLICYTTAYRSIHAHEPLFRRVEEEPREDCRAHGQSVDEGQSLWVIRFTSNKKRYQECLSIEQIQSRLAAR
jgi:hypothetical protein